MERARSSTSCWGSARVLAPSRERAPTDSSATSIARILTYSLLTPGVGGPGPGGGPRGPGSGRAVPTTWSGRSPPARRPPRCPEPIAAPGAVPVEVPPRRQTWQGRCRAGPPSRDTLGPARQPEPRRCRPVTGGPEGLPVGQGRPPRHRQPEQDRPLPEYIEADSFRDLPASVTFADSREYARPVASTPEMWGLRLAAASGRP
jgi:hypothetical protein